MGQIYSPAWSTDRRKEMRNHPTRDEKMLWFFLRKSRIGFKFRRQAGIGPYIVDFCCPRLKVVVELDGAQHMSPSAKEYDEIRDDYLRTLDFVVFRIPNHRLRSDFDGVIAEIETLCKSRAEFIPNTTED